MALNPETLLVRQSRLISPDLQQVTAIVAGTGMVGSWLAHLLVRLVGRMEIFDDDVVDEENLGTQSFNYLQTGQFKVAALASTMRGLGDVVANEYRFPPARYNPLRPFFVVSAVDSMAGRREIARWALAKRADAFIDCRILGELAAVYILSTPADFRWYLAGEIPADDDVPDIACGATGTPYVGMWVAARAMAAINNHYSQTPERRKVVWHVGINSLVGE